MRPVVISTEAELYEYLKVRYLQDLKMSSDADSTYDCTSEYGKLLIELKCRSTHYDELILERDKYENMSYNALALGYAAWYVNSTPKGVYAFNLAKLNLTWTTRLLPIATRPNKLQVIGKTVAFLHVSQAVAL